MKIKKMPIPRASIALWVAAAVFSGCVSAPQGKRLKESEQVDLYIEGAASALSVDDTVLAFEYVIKAEAIQPSRADLQHTKALVYIARKDFPAALESAKKAVSLDPKSSGANNTYGKLLLDSGRAGEAVPHLNVAAKDPLNREAFKAWTNLGILFYKRGEFGRAKDALDRAIERSQGVACVAYFYRGHLRLRESRFKEAAADYDSATKRFCAGFGEAHLALGIAYERNKQYDQARKKFLEVQERFGTSEIGEQASSHLRTLP